MPEETFRWVITGAVGIATLCIVAMAGVLLAMYRVVSNVKVKVEDVATRVEPIIDRVRTIADQNGPKIAGITANVETISANAVSVSANLKDMSEVARDQTVRFGDVGKDIADRTKAQAARVDQAIDETVIQLRNAGENARQTAMKPVREASAVLAGIKAGLGTFFASQRRPIDHIAQDEEMFI